MNDVVCATMADRVAELSNRIAAAFSDSEVDLMPFPSGSVMLDVRRHGRVYVLAYSTGRGFGVDELHEDEGFDTGYAFVSEDFESASARLWDLVSTSSPRES